MLKRALISVYNKEGITKLAQELANLGWEIISTGGTARTLEEAGVKIIPIEEVTKNPEAFGGRMKTISFEIESAILFNRNNSGDVKQAKKLGILPIDLVVANLYPFKETIARPDIKVAEAIEMIDIGGPTMIRAAAKNYEGVTVVIDTNDYDEVLKELKQNNETSLETRQKLAQKVFETIARYDDAINVYLAEKFLNKKKLLLSFGQGETLRYGENPHQEASVYQEIDSGDDLAINKFQKLQGKGLSFNNYLDIDGVLEAISRLGGKKPACVVVKHTNPCGAAIRDNIHRAYEDAWAGDSLAAFGGIIAVNRSVDKKLAQKMIDKKFFEILLAPEVSEDTLKIFAKKKSLRVLINPALKNPFLPKPANNNPPHDFKQIRGGLVIQDKDIHEIKTKDLKIVTKVSPTKDEIKDLLFAWKIAQSSKSNTIVLARDEMLIGSGVGQQDRKRCTELAVGKAGERAKNSVAASDAFFPFRDGPDTLIKAGIKAIIQPGGSLRDQESIDACDEAGVAMVFTGVRCFKH